MRGPGSRVASALSLALIHERRRTGILGSSCISALRPPGRDATPTSPLGGAVLGLVLVVLVVLVASSLPVAVGGLAHRFLVLQARPQGSRDRCQGGRKPGERQVLPEAHRVLEDGLEVVARHE